MWQRFVLLQANLLPSLHRLFFDNADPMNVFGKIALGVVASVVVYQFLKIRSVRNTLVDAVVDSSVYLIKRKLLK